VAQFFAVPVANNQLKTYVGAEWGFPGLLTSFGAWTLPKGKNSQEERSLEPDFGAELVSFKMRMTSR